MRKNLKNKKGFTLIELIVVIAILGILAVIAIPRLSGFSETARERSDIANAKTIANQVAVLHTDGTIAPATFTLTGVPAAGSDLEDILDALGGNWPTPRAAAAGAGNNQFEVAIDAAGVITVVTTGGAGADVALYPTPAAAYQ